MWLESVEDNFPHSVFGIISTTSSIVEDIEPLAALRTMVYFGLIDCISVPFYSSNRRIVEEELSNAFKAVYMPAR